MMLRTIVLLLSVISGCSGVSFEYKVELITPGGSPFFANSTPSVTIVSAVGCSQQLNITYFPDSSGKLPDTVNIYRTDSNFSITAAAGLIPNTDAKAQNLICCSHYPLDRNIELQKIPKFQSSTCLGGEYNLNYFDFFQCSLFTVDTIKNTKVAAFYFIPPAGSDITNNGMVSFRVQPILDSRPGNPLIVNIEIRQCNACILKGEGLNAFAKRFYTHWLQVFSSNPEIDRNPNQIMENSVIRLGPLYSVRTGDTLMSLATKFGVTVNQLLFWNQFLRSTASYASDGSIQLSQSISPGQLLCILPKTCYNSFGGAQPIFSQREVTQGFGGSAGVPYQILNGTSPL
mmetsp:Transcript_22461/g.50614  ORF Transcript_22461/g.50614 Transcript_22461/m.50614 type:complete len:344 (+) Transcript_22461:218-1249(+)